MAAFVLTSQGGSGDDADVAVTAGLDRDEEATTTVEERSTTTRARPTTTTVDPAVVRAQLQSEYDAAVAAACEQTVAEPLQRPPSALDLRAGSAYEPEWLPVGTREQFIASVQACSAPQRAARLEAECQTEAPVELMNRDPDQFENQCFTLVFSIVQFDQGTGRCAFRASFDNVAREYNFEYLGENALVSFSDPCPELDPVGNDDVLRIRVVSLGGLSYDTTIGGSATAAAFQAVGGPELIQDN